MVAILSRPPVPPPVPVNQWPGITCEWIGADGSVWDLATGAGGVVLQRPGVEGLHNPPITKFASKSRVVPGDRPRGWRTEPRPVFWPALVFSNESADEWKDRYQRFFHSIHPSNAGTWRIGHGGEYRTLQCTGVFDNPHTFGQDPLVFGWEKFGIALEAHQPYWSGDPITLGPWSQGISGEFFGDTGAPDFFISTSSEIGRAFVSNPGDVEAWLTWTLVGPLSDVEIGIGDTVASIPFNLTAGQVLVIDTDPRHQTGVRDGVDVTKQLGLLSYGAIPPGSDIEVVVEAAGAGSISSTLTPLYFRAM